VGRGASPLDDIEVLFTWYAEDALDAFVLQRGNQKIGALGHGGTVANANGSKTSATRAIRSMRP
jgi:hypothetical protein